MKERVLGEVVNVMLVINDIGIKCKLVKFVIRER